MNPTFESGLYSLMANSPVLTDFWGTDDNKNSEYQVFYLGAFDPVSTPPYCVFWRHKRQPEMDLDGIPRQFVSGYFFEIYHTSSWESLELQARLRTFLESLEGTVVGGVFVQSLIVMDDFHVIPPKEERIRLYKGVLDVEVTYNPN